MSKIRVLHILHGMETFGGVESFLLQYYGNIDRNEITFDFLMCCNNTLEKYEEYPIIKGSKITALHALKTGGNSFRNYKKLIQEVNYYLNNNCYDIVHINTTNIILQTVLARYMRCNCLRIAHSHSATPKQAHETLKSLIMRFLKSLATPLCQGVIRKNNDYLLACSETAGESLFGKKGVSCSKFKVVRNAIEPQNFIFDKEQRKHRRISTDATDDCHIYGTVGRLAESKNLLFLIDIFKHIHDKNENTQLWIVGEGPMRQKIEERIHAQKLESVVILFGEQKQVSSFLMGMDYFLFPTVYEGLGIVAIEAQAAGLPVITSDAVPAEAKVTKHFHSLSLRENAASWAEYVLNIEINTNREASVVEVIEHGYDIKDASKDLLSFYRKAIENEIVR